MVKQTLAYKNKMKALSWSTTKLGPTRRRVPKIRPGLVLRMDDQLEISKEVEL
jgi:hypothetical protein